MISRTSNKFLPDVGELAFGQLEIPTDLVESHHLQLTRLGKAVVIR